MTTKARGLWEAFVHADDQYKEVQREFLSALQAGDIGKAEELRPTGRTRNLFAQGCYLQFRVWAEQHPDELTEEEAALLREEAVRRTREVAANDQLIVLALLSASKAPATVN